MADENKHIDPLNNPKAEVKALGFGTVSQPPVGTAPIAESPAPPVESPITPQPGESPNVEGGLKDEDVWKHIRSHEKFNGIFGETDNFNTLHERLTNPKVVEKEIERNFSDEDKKALELGKTMISRPDVLSLVEATQKGVNPLYYSQVMSLKPTEMNDLEAIITQRMWEGKAIDRQTLEKALQYEYMLFPEEEYQKLPDYNETFHASRKAAAEIQLKQQAEKSRQFLIDLQEKAKMPEEYKKRVADEAELAEHRTKNSAEWQKALQNGFLSDLTATVKHTANDMENTYPYSLKFDEQTKEKLTSFANTFLGGLLEANPNFAADAENLKFVRDVVLGGHLLNDFPTIVQDIWKKAIASESERQAMERNNPKKSLAVQPDAIKEKQGFTKESIYGKAPATYP